MAGDVVLAQAGRRDAYRPLATPLCRSSRPDAVVARLLDLHPFRHLYIADLDAILGRGGHEPVIEAIRRNYPDLELWVDAGFAGPEAARAWQARGLGRAVLGSESLAAAPGRDELPAGAVLSLDFKDDAFAGPARLLAEPERWPAEVIVMTLARVGTGTGPDLARLAALRLAALRRAAPAARLHAAGGVRHAGDLAELARAGAAGVLLASALHDGRLGRRELSAWQAGA